MSAARFQHPARQRIDDALAWLRARAQPQADLHADTRALKAGDVFLAYAVEGADNRPFIANAIERGAAAVLYQPEGFVADAASATGAADTPGAPGAPFSGAPDSCGLPGLAALPSDSLTAPLLAVPALDALAGEIASGWYGDPSDAMLTIGVTGTNGKTSCSQWIATALGTCRIPNTYGTHGAHNTHGAHGTPPHSTPGLRCAIIGTLGSGLPGQLVHTGFTTPDAPQLQRSLAQLRDAGAQAVAMEVSSHALHQGRVNGVAFDIAVFTNLTQDHLDYHRTLDAYEAAKARLFAWPGLRCAVVNADDAAGCRLLAQTRARRVRTIAYGVDAGASAGIDADIDTGIGADVEAGAKASVKTGARAGNEAGIGVNVDADARTSVNAGVRAGNEAGIGMDVKAGARTSDEAGARAGNEAVIGANVEADARTSVKAGVRAGNEAVIGTDVKAGARTNDEAGIRAGNESDIGANVKANARTRVKTDAKTSAETNAKAGAAGTQGDGTRAACSADAADTTFANTSSADAAAASAHALAHADAWLRATAVRATATGTAFHLATSAWGEADVHVQTLGLFNVSNLLGVLGALLAAGAPLTGAAGALAALAKLEPVNGRMQRLGGRLERDEPLVVVDYAHTPDALEKTLAALRPMATARGGALVCVFGCGGERDATKRPLMGAIAERLADQVVVTSDNPRGEASAAIIDQIVAGMRAPQQARRIEDRAGAILHAIRCAAREDVIVLAGKGHEATQEIMGKKRVFSDQDHARLALAARPAATSFAPGNARHAAHKGARS